VYYDSRRIEDEGMTFVFRANEPGTYSLKFNRQDFIRDIILNDYVQVLVEEAPHITGNAWANTGAAPDKVSAGPPVPVEIPATAESPGEDSPRQTADSPAGAQGVSAPAELARNNGGPEELLGKAKTEYDAGHIAAALTALNQFKEKFPGGSDEAWWLYAQALEANSPERDVRLALDYYRRLVREYPQSARYDDAVKRIAYLERFYFTIQ
jgi:tetratricopeptide (TPR) repeat protein